MINLSAAPYYDDFDPSKNYHKILFVPGRAIQARELTQIQSVLQHQVKMGADYMFKNGAMIVPGNINYTPNVTYIKLASIYNSVLTDSVVESLVGKKIVGSTTQVTATVIHAEKSTATEPPILFINYVSGGVVNNENFTAFKKNETLTFDDITTQIVDSNTFTGRGSLASIEEGIYYINGFYVQNNRQVISLDKFSSEPTYRVGLAFNDAIVTSFDDPSLKDVAIDSSNFGVVGADRYQINLVLSKREMFLDQENHSTTTEQFIDLLHVKNGEIQFKVNRTELAEFEKTLARRTYDESGDYIVEPFKFNVLDYRNNNRGSWSPSTIYLEGDVVNSNTQYFVALTNGVSGAIAPTITHGEFLDNELTWLATNSPTYNNGLVSPSSEQTIDEQINAFNTAAYKISGGKAYIKGFEIENIGYKTVTFDKARDFKQVSSAIVDSDFGQYLNVNSVMGIPSTNYIDASNKAIPKYNIKNAAGTVVGTCRVRNLEYSSGAIGTGSAVYKLSVFDVAMNSNYTFANDAKAVTSALNTTFSAKVIGNRFLKSGGVKTTGSSTTLEGNGTLFSVELQIGNTIVINNASYRVQSIIDSVTLTLDRAVTLAAYTPFYLEKTVLQGSTNSLIKQLPNTFIRSVRGINDSSIQTEYYVKRTYQQAAVAGVVTINLISIGETFAPILSGNHLVTLADGSAFINTASFTLVNPVTLQITGLAGTSTYRISTTVKKTSVSAQEKQKIRKIKTVTLNTINSVDKAEILLLEADVVGIVSITQSGGALFNFASRTASVSYTELGEIDISRYYTLDTGQTPFFYGLGKIVPNVGFIPSAPIRVTYEYFDHTDGDYFSINSYDIPYALLPTLSNGGFSADYLDFRPRISDSGNEFDESTGASLVEPLSSTYDLITDYSYYLPRRDIIQVNSEGAFRVEQGVAADHPIAPIANDNNVILAYVDMLPYTTSASATNVKLTINAMKRYTMKDIGSIANRLSNVEYYTALSTLEKATADLQIKDEYGLDRYKNGFIIDQFKDHGVGDVNALDYKCAIDPSLEECRPKFYASDIKLLEKLAQSRIANNYQITGDIVTLPYSNVKLIEQLRATSAEFITPYTHLRSLNGDLNIFPASDTWVDTETAPDIIQTSEGNFGFVQAVAQAEGMLGTVWNSWQEVGRTTLNSSVSTSTNTSNNRWGRWWGSSSTTTTTTTTQSGTDLVNRTRAGTNTFIQEQWDEVGRTTNVVDEKWAPWMRSKAIVLYSKRMMPNILFTAYVDSIDLGAYIVPASTIRFTNKVGSFTDYNKSNFNQSDLVARTFGENSYDILERGEVIRGKTSNATAVIVCEETQTGNTGSEVVLKVLNTKGTFTVGETIIGQTSGASCVFVSRTVESKVITNSAGSFYGILMIPNNAQVRIPAGIITISLRDKLVVEDSTTTADTNYDAHGLIQVKQTTIMSVRNGVVATRAVSQNSQTSENWSRVIGTSVAVTNCNCNCGDPLAQTFKHSDVGGSFVTKIDLYFHTIDQDPAMGITFQIREVINGYPGPRVVPFSQVTLMPHEIISSKTELIPTTFTFQSPVFLEAEKEYCFVLATELSNSKVWITKMGEVSIDGELITKQPNMGSFFRSQNNTTWDADQLSDMCFTLYKAKFNTAKFGHLTFQNSATNNKQLEVHPFKIVAGSTLVRVAHPNHGFIAGSKVTFSGVTSNLTQPTATELNRSFTVANVELDSYTITITNAASDTGWYGGGSVKATQSNRMDTMFLRGNDFVLPNTHINYTFKTSKQAGSRIVKSSIDYPIQVRRNFVFDNPQFVLDSANQASFLADDNSLEINAFLYSNNENLSPVIDITTYSAHAISNRINNPTAALNLAADANTLFTISAPITGTIVFNVNGTITFSGAGLVNYFDELDAVKPGRYIQFTGDTSNSNPILVTAKEKSSNMYILRTSDTLVSRTVTNPSNHSLKQFEYFVSPIISTDSSSNYANYVTRLVQLEKQSSSFKLIFDYNKMPAASIDVYYKTGLKSAYSSVSTSNWILVPTTFLATYNYDVFTESDITIDTDTFDQITVKLVFRSDNTSEVPRIRNFRLLALA